MTAVGFITGLAAAAGLCFLWLWLPIAVVGVGLLAGVAFEVFGWWSP